MTHTVTKLAEHSFVLLYCQARVEHVVNMMALGESNNTQPIDLVMYHKYSTALTVCKCFFIHVMLYGNFFLYDSSCNLIGCYMYVHSCLSSAYLNWRVKCVH